MKAKHFLQIIFLLITTSFLLAQKQPLIAVIPLRSLGGISQEEAETVTNLLETGLVKSVMFQVVEKSEIAEVLAAQEYSAEEYVDENFAAKLGKLLSAEQIVLGTLSHLGDKYFLTAKIIDVATGRTLRADKDEANSIEAIASQAEILGYRLAGLQLGKNGRKPPLRSPEHSARLERQAMEQKQAELLSAKYVLEHELQTETIRSKKLRTAGRVFYGISTGFVLGSGTALIWYIGAGQRDEALNTLWGGVSVCFGVIGSISAIIGTMLWLEHTDLESIKEKIKQVESEMVNN